MNSHLLFITRKWPPAVGGMETYSVELVDQLDALGYEIDLRALPGRPNGQSPRALAIIGFGFRTVFDLVLRRGSWRAVLGGDLAVWPLALVAAKVGRTQPRVVLAAHGTDISFASRKGLLGRTYREYLKLCLRLYGSTPLIIAANSDATADRAKALGFPRVKTIPLGGRTPELSLPPESPDTILFPGRLVRRKGLSWFVSEVLPRLPENIRVQVCGTVWDRSEEEALKDPRVDFVGPVPQPDLWRRMGAALCVVLPNVRSGTHQFEGFGLVAAEAAAAGGLVLAARLDGYLNSVIDGKTGHLLPSGDAEAWSAAIIDLAQLPAAERAERRLLAQGVAREAFSWERVARDTAALFDDLTHNKGGD